MGLFAAEATLFPLSPEARRYFVDAAVAAARELGLRDADDVDACAARLGLRARIACARSPPCCPSRTRGALEAAPLPPGGWGELASVIRCDRPLDTSGLIARFHGHLAKVGHEDARLVATRVAMLPEAAGGLVDLGAGAGVYAEAFLAARPAGKATLVDRAEVLALAPPRARQQLVARDLFDVAPDAELPHHGVALLANVVHLYDAADGARLVARAASLADVVVVKDVWIEPDRRGPLRALLFALNMALYTDGGGVHPTADLVAWLAAAGLGAPTVERLGEDVLVWARR